MLSIGVALFEKKKWLKIVTGAVILFSLLLLLLLNKVLVIYLLIGVLFIWLLKIIFLDDKKISKLWITVPTISIILLFIFVLIDFSQFIPNGISDSILLNQKTSASIAWNSLLNSPVWGSGPQTFIYDFTLFRPSSFNDSTFWNIQFIKSGNEFWNIATTTGLGGIISILLLGFIYFFRNTREILRFKKINIQTAWIVLIFLSVLILFVIGLFMPFNFILYWVFWLLLAVSISLFRENKKENDVFEIKLNNKSRTYQIVIIIFVIFSISTLLLLLSGGRIWLADYHFTKAQQNISSRADMDIIFTQLDTSIRLNKYESKYYLTLAQGYTTQALLESQTDGISTESVQNTTQQVINNINLAKKYDGDNSLVYKKAAIMYDSLRPIVGNVDELAVKDYLSAVELDPTNPLINFNLGRSRLLLAQTILSASGSETSTEEAFAILDDALDDFEKTRKLKNDYFLIDYNIGLAYQIKGDYNKALEMFMIELKKYPDSLDIKWQISLAYEQQGEIEKSVMYLEEIILTNANNEIVLKKLEELKNILSKEEINE